MFIHRLGHSVAVAGFGVQSSVFVADDNVSSGVLVDCGSGVANTFVDSYRDCLLDAVILTHNHADHVVDVPALGYFLQFVKNVSSSVDLFCPDVDRFVSFMKSVGAENQIGSVWNVLPLEDKFKIKNFGVQSVLVPHVDGMVTKAVKISHDFSSVVVSADCCYNNGLIGLAADCSLLICEASMADKESNGVHMNIFDAATVAKEANAQELWITHYAEAAFDDFDEAVKDARSIFKNLYFDKEKIDRNKLKNYLWCEFI